MNINPFIICFSILIGIVGCKQQPQVEFQGKYRITNIDEVMHKGAYKNWIVEFAANNILISEYMHDSVHYIQLGKWNKIGTDKIEFTETGSPSIGRTVSLAKPNSFGIINQNEDTIKYQTYQSEQNFNIAGILNKEWITLNDSMVFGFDSIQVQPNYTNYRYEFKSDSTYNIFPFKDKDRQFKVNFDSTYILLDNVTFSTDLIRIISVTPDTLKFSRRDNFGEMKMLICTTKSP
ncbi:MAG: hypothetical protein OCD76_17970 [Reichenbachiella sp.]